MTELKNEVFAVPQLHGDLLKQWGESKWRLVHLRSELCLTRMKGDGRSKGTFFNMGNGHYQRRATHTH